VPIRHGNKHYTQVLLDGAKFTLLESIAESRGIKVTALARDIIYKWLGENVVPELFEEANKLDQLMWEESVKNRVKGRQKKKNAPFNEAD